MVEAKTHPHVLCRRGNCVQGQSGLRGQVYLFIFKRKGKEEKRWWVLVTEKRRRNGRAGAGEKGWEKVEGGKGLGGKKRFKAEAQSRCWCWWWWMQLVEMQSCYHETHLQPPHCTLSPLMSVCVFVEKEQEGDTETGQMAKSSFFFLCFLQSCWLWVKNLLLSLPKTQERPLVITTVHLKAMSHHERECRWG